MSEPADPVSAAALDPALAALAAEARDRAGRLVEGPEGLFAVTDERYPRSHDSNKVVAPQPVAVDVLLAFAEEALGTAGLTYRQLVVLRGGEALEPDAVEAGYTSSRIRVMTLPSNANLGSPDPAIDVRAVDETTLRPLVERTWYAESPDFDAETVRQLVGRRDAYTRAGTVTPYVAHVDGVPAAHADLRTRGKVAEIDSVATYPAYRGRGLARALVLTAAAAARQAGADVVFLQADADDWPQEMYARLGFGSVGTIHEFHRRSP